MNDENRHIIVSPDEGGFVPQARVLYATAMARSLNFILKRDYLNHISVSPALDTEPGYSFLMKEKNLPAPIWLKIDQVGLPVKDTFKACFDALQRILLFCAHQSQVLFLVVHMEGQYHMYLGIRVLPEGPVGGHSFVTFLRDFSQSLWNGLSCSEVSCNDKNPSPSYKPIKDIMEESTRFEKVIALTGIPTSDLEQDGAYPLSIDNLLKSLRGKKVAYLVCADPVNPDEIDESLYEIREAQGQMESIKTMSIQHTQGFSDTHTHCKSWSTSHSKKDFQKLEADVMGFLQDKIGFKPAAAIMKAAKAGGAVGGAAVAGQALLGGGAAGAAGAAAVVSPQLMAGVALAGLASGVFIGSVSDQEGGNDSDAHGKSSSDSIGQTIVNKHAESVAKQLDVYARRYETGRATGMWNVGVYLMGADKDVENAAYQLTAISSGKSSVYEPIRRHDITRVVEKCEHFDLTSMPDIYAATFGRVFEHPIGKRNSELRTILTTRELTAYINLPLKAVDGINAVPTTPDFSMRPPKTTGADTELKIGKLLNGGTATEMDCTLDLRTLCKHSLVAGINGSGKTNTVLNILTEVKRQGKPFLIIEPAKSEYVDWAFRYNVGKSPEEQIRILMPGKECYAAPVGEDGARVQTKLTERLRFNPFEVMDLGFGNPEDAGNKRNAHIDLVKTMFGLAFPMHDILPAVLELMIYDLYKKTAENGIKNPTLWHMWMTCEGDFIKNLGYDDKNTMIIRGAMRTRIQNLRQGWKKTLLENDSIKGMTWSEFFSKPTVLNLSAVGDDSDKSFIMGLILMFLFEYWQNVSEKEDFVFSDNELNHLLVIEEAHRIMTAHPDPDSPMYKVGRFFTNFLTEMRAYGQGLMIVDQVPGRLIPDAVSNTNLKIVHKMVSGSDIDALSVSMGLSPEQKQMISRLSTGQCIISGINSIHVGATSDDDVYWCLMYKMK